MREATVSRIEQGAGAVVGFLAPLIIQLATGDAGWSATAGLDAGVIATWLLARAHVSATTTKALSDLAVAETTKVAKALSPVITGGHGAA